MWGEKKVSLLGKKGKLLGRLKNEEEGGGA